MGRSGFLRNIHVGIARGYMYVSEPLVNYIFLPNLTGSETTLSGDHQYRIAFDKIDDMRSQGAQF